MELINIFIAITFFILSAKFVNSFNLLYDLFTITLMIFKTATQIKLIKAKKRLIKVLYLRSLFLFVF